MWIFLPTICLPEVGNNLTTVKFKFGLNSFTMKLYHILIMEHKKLEDGSRVL